MKDILKEIIEVKKREIIARKKTFPPDDLAHEVKRIVEEESHNPSLKRRNFLEVIRGKDHISIIAEIKRGSPSNGLFREDFDEMEYGKIYLAGEAKRSLFQKKRRGVAAISVVTDYKFFAGDNNMLRNLRKISPIPLLRKDFIIDEYQIYESKFLGADAILLIASLFSEEALRSFIQKTQALSMDALVEIGDERDLAKAILAGADIIGINNRNLKDFSIDLRRTADLTTLIPDGKIIVSESGFKDPKDLKQFEGMIDAVLIGSMFIQSENPQEKVCEFLAYNL